MCVWRCVSRDFCHRKGKKSRLQSKCGRKSKETLIRMQMPWRFRQVRVKFRKGRLRLRVTALSILARAEGVGSKKIMRTFPLSGQSTPSIFLLMGCYFDNYYVPDPIFTNVFHVPQNIPQSSNMRVIASLLFLATVFNAFQALIVSRGRPPCPTRSHHAPAPFVRKIHSDDTHPRNKIFKSFSCVCDEHF
jgi:hypothetical protein